MGQLIDGAWQTDIQLAHTKDGAFERPASRFRHWITPDGGPGPDGSEGFPAEAGRYHLYVSLACPWAHRTLIFRAIKGLQDIIGLSVVHWRMGPQGWTFELAEGATGDQINGAAVLHQIYTKADPHCSGRVTVPVLWDIKRATIVNNESSEIIRMFNSAFNHLGARPGDYYPAHLRDDIDHLNERIYATLNNGVYRCGFATTQAAYEAAVVPLFETLDFLEQRLASRRFLCGDTPTEADWRLLPTLLRFDMVYYSHFKCNLLRIADYANLWAYTRALYQWPAVRDTVNFTHIKRHYYASQLSVNPTGIWPLGPTIDFDAPATR